MACAGRRASRSAPRRIWPPSAGVRPLIPLKSVVVPAPLRRATTTRQRASVLDQVTTGGSLLGERLPDQRVARPAAWRVLGQPGEIDGLPHVTGRVWVKAGSVENVDHIVLVLEGQVEEGLGHLVASDVEHEILGSRSWPECSPGRSAHAGTTPPPGPAWPRVGSRCRRSRCWPGTCPRVISRRRCC